MKTKPLMIIGLLLLLVSGSDARACFDIEIDCNGPANRKQRVALARALFERINQLCSAIPELSPEQKTWLEVEMSSDDPHRRLKASESDEAYLRNSSDHIGKLKSALASILYTKYEDPKREILLWLSVTCVLMDWSFTTSVAELVNRDLIHLPDYRFGEPVLLSVECGRIGQKILIHIVTPHIAGTLPE